MTLYRRRHQTYVVAVWFLPVALLSQIGLAFFGVPLAIHGTLGAIVGIVALVLVCLQAAAHAARSHRMLGFGMVGLIGIQPWLIAFRPEFSALGTVHAINAFVILALACALALDAEDTQTSSRAQPGIAAPDR
jgi:hypothetical protein